jgi:SAM-dependent methyltransferase
LRRFPSFGQLLEAFFAPPGASEEVRKDCQEAWKAHCYNQDLPIYECWTSDYIDALVRYLLECRQRYASDCADGKPLRVLEAGAGTGKLTLGLRQALTRLVYLPSLNPSIFSTIFTTLAQRSSKAVETSTA